jgi:hypothetical protein
MLAARYCVWAAVFLLADAFIGTNAIAQTSNSGQDELHRLVASAKIPLVVQGGIFSGPGWGLITREVSAARLVAVGEDHLTREVPEFVSALCDALGPRSLAAMAVETGPEAARFMQKRVSSDRHDLDMAELTKAYPDSVAFFNVTEENDLLTHCATAAGRSGFEIWGLDQEFFGAGGWLLDMILDEPLDSDARDAIQQLRAEEKRDAQRATATGDPSKLFLICVADSTLETARKRLMKGGDERSRQLFDAIVTTHKIYQENAEGSPRANLDRAVLLKKELLTHLDRWRSSAMSGKILLKFGDWHLYRGRAWVAGGACRLRGI